MQSRSISHSPGVATGDCSSPELNSKPASVPAGSFARVNRAISDPLNHRDMQDAMAVHTMRYGMNSKRFVDGMFLGGPYLGRRALRHWNAGNYMRAALYALPTVPLCTLGVCGDFATPFIGLANRSRKPTARTPDGAWADRLVGSLRAHVSANDWGRSLAEIQQEREQLGRVRSIVAGKAHRARNSEEVCDELSAWEHKIDRMEKALIKAQAWKAEHAAAAKMVEQIDAARLRLNAEKEVAMLPPCIVAGETLIAEMEHTLRERVSGQRQVRQSINHLERSIHVAKHTVSSLPGAQG